MPWPQHQHQARLMGHRVRKYPASPYPRPSARAVTEASRVRVSGSGLGFAARLCCGLVRTPLAGTSAYTLTTTNRGARVVVFLRPGHPKPVTWVVRRRVLDVAMWRSASDVCRYLAARSHARCGCAGGTRASARTRSRPGHLGMRAAGVCVTSCDQRRAGDSRVARRRS